MTRRVPNDFGREERFWRTLKVFLRNLTKYFVTVAFVFPDVRQTGSEWCCPIYIFWVPSTTSMEKLKKFNWSWVFSVFERTFWWRGLFCLQRAGKIISAMKYRFRKKTRKKFSRPWSSVSLVALPNAHCNCPAGHFEQSDLENINAFMIFFVPLNKQIVMWCQFNVSHARGTTWAKNNWEKPGIS